MFKKNASGQFIHVQGVDTTTGGIKSGVTWTVRRCIDGTFAAATGTATEDGTTGWYKFALSQADTNGNNIGFNFTGTGAVPQTVNIITDGAAPDVNVTKIAGQTASAAGTVTFPGTVASSTNITSASGVSLAADQAVNTTKFGGTTVTARDIGASVLLSSGTGTGQLDFTSGVVKANLVQILGSAITGTAANIVAAFTKWFNVTSPTGTVNSLPDAVAGASGGVFIAGTNAATTVTTALTTTFTGNLTGSVGSLGTTAKSDVNAEVVDALNVDTYPEPGQEAPPATASLVTKNGYLYKAFRNRKTQTSTTMSLYADNATTVDQKATISDNGTTYDHGEIGTGP